MNDSVRRIIAAATLLLAIVLIIMGARGEHTVFTGKHDEFGQELKSEISDREMVVQTTFGGVLREDGRLQTRGGEIEKAGKKACPT